MLNLQQNIRKEAAKWFTRMHNAAVDHPERGAFEAWLMRSHVHADEYLAIAAVWDDFDSTESVHVLAEAMTRKKAVAKMHRKNLMQRASKVAMFLFVGIFSIFGFNEWQSQPLMQLSRTTQIAQTMKQTLEDGSKLTLNANTEIDVTYYRNKRLVTLKHGEVIFDVVKDTERPFVVESPMARVTVLGTRFVVNEIDGRAIVSVDHGRVRVEAADSNQTPHFEAIILTNGQVAEVKAGFSPKRLPRSAADAFAFAEGSLMFDNATLVEIAQSLSRYRKVPVVAIGQSVNAPRITAVLKIAEIESFLHALPNTAPVLVVHSNQTTQLISK